MTVAVLSVGSNMGDSVGALRTVRDRFADRLVGVSAVFTTPPWGPVPQDDFDNAVLIVDDPSMSPDLWLRAGTTLEQAADRRRDVRWGPRSLDVDVVSVTGRDGVVVSDDPVLTLPHPRAHSRAFVLIPWLDADPGATLWTPTGERHVADLVAELPTADRDGVRPRIVDGWTVFANGASP